MVEKRHQAAIAPVTSAERAARQLYPGGVLWLTGLSGAGKSTLATALERHLFDRGLRVMVLDGDVMRACRSSRSTSTRRWPCVSSAIRKVST